MRDSDASTSPGGGAAGVPLRTPYRRAVLRIAAAFGPRTLHILRRSCAVSLQKELSRPLEAVLSLTWPRKPSVNLLPFCSVDPNSVSDLSPYVFLRFRLSTNGKSLFCHCSSLQPIREKPATPGRENNYNAQAATSVRASTGGFASRGWCLEICASAACGSASGRVRDTRWPCNCTSRAPKSGQSKIHGHHRPAHAAARHSATSRCIDMSRSPSRVRTPEPGAWV
jgi:hypothetical protein